MDGVPLDALITRMLARSPFDYRVAADDPEREVAYRLRGSAVLDRGWCTAGDLPGGMERDGYDDRAVHVIGWDGDVAMSTGRVVLPPGLPTDAERPRSARQPADPPAARTSAVLAPPKPKEFDSA